MSSVERSTQIGVDADQWSLSRSASNSQSAVGLGTVSGRAILAVGELALRGVEMLTITVTLQHISSRIRGAGTPRQALLPQDLQDLLELQRIGLYPKFVRRKAWVLLHILFDQERVDDIIVVLLTWAALEVQLFLRQLVSYHLTTWSSLVKDLPNATDTGSAARVANSINRILIAILRHDSFIVHEIYDVYIFARLLSPRSDAGRSKGSRKTRDSLTRFFDQWIQHVARQPQHEELLSATALIAYLSHGSQRQIQVVVSHVVSAISPFAYIPDDDEDDPTFHMHKKVKDVFKQYPSLHSDVDAASMHPVSFFLLFVQLLSQESQIASEVFVSSGLVDILKRFHTIRYFNGTDQPPHTVHHMDALCQSVLNMLDSDTDLQPLSRPPSFYTYPSRSTSRPPSLVESATLRGQPSSDSLSSLRAVFRLKMPAPPPPPSPTLPHAPPPSPSMSFYNLSPASDETLATFIGLEIRPPSGVVSIASSTFTDETEEVPSTPRSDQLVTLESSPSTFYAELSGTDCATVGVRTISSRYLSRRSTMRTLRSSSRSPSHPSSVFAIPTQKETSFPDSLFHPETKARSLSPSFPPSSPTASSLHSDIPSQETVNGHDELTRLEDEYESVYLDSESYFGEFGSAMNHETQADSWSTGLKDSKARRIARRLASVLRTLKTKD